MLHKLKKMISYDNPFRRLWHLGKGMIAAIKYGFPAKKMVCIGVTGTNGKTTTTHMIEHLLRSSGKKVAMLSTVNFSINGDFEENTSKKTTMSPFLTQKFLRQCVRKDVDYVVIESSSHALHQFRLWGIPFCIATLTNITHEHLDYHGTMEKYKEAKKMLFKIVAKQATIRSTMGSTIGNTVEPEQSPTRLGICHDPAIILNTADHYFEEFNQIDTSKITYGFDCGDLQAREATYSKFGSEFTLSYHEKTSKVALKVPASFNVENALAATGVAFTCGLSFEEIKHGLESFEGVPGRMERIVSPRGFEVIVDFGLTPDALERLYSTIRETAIAKVIGIIGSCGDRDKTKRPELGRIVATYSDLTIVTDEEPYTENPRAIMDAVFSGAETVKIKGIGLELIEDRYEAIEYAVAHAKEGDTIVITGMGNFTTRTLNQGPIKWDEREVVREIIARDGTVRS